MAFEHGVTQTNVENEQPTLIYENTDSGSTFTLVKLGSVNIFWVQVDNSLNPSGPVFVQLFDNLTPVVGSTAADEIVFCPPGLFRTTPKKIIDRSGLSITIAGVFDHIPILGSAVVTVPFFTAANPGKILGGGGSGLTVACVIDLTGAVSPSNPVTIRICYQ